ncbi:MAG: BMP family ABC transporter substrate-binding protein [bacterium]|nr:BMP family ABC transporter substrate-binding protein [bacterium]
MSIPSLSTNSYNSHAEDGFDIVLAHGSQFGGSLSEIAPDFPDTVFAWGTSRDTFGLPNVYSYSVQSDEGGFVNGTIAAHMTESNVIGVVGPIEVGDIKLYIDGFVAGVKSVDPSITSQRQLHRLLQRRRACS